MAGNITVLDNNRYKLRYSYKGKTYSKNIKADTRKKAEKQLTNFIYEIEHSKNNDTTNMYFNDFANIWFEQYVEKNLSAKTQLYYKGLLNPHITNYFNGFRLNEIKRIHIIQFLDSVNDKYTKASLDKYRKCLNTIFNYAIKCELLEINPCTLVESPKGKEHIKKANVYTLEQVQQLLQHLKQENIDKQCIIELGLFCGLRRQEIMALNKDDLDFNDNSIAINKAMVYDPFIAFTEGKTKTAGSNRTVYMPQNLANKLKTFPNGRLFPYNLDAITKWFKKFIKKNNLSPLTIHGLRHTHATLLIANGTDYKTVSSALGHSQTSTTMNIYVHKNTDNIKKASSFFEKF